MFPDQDFVSSEIVTSNHPSMRYMKVTPKIIVVVLAFGSAFAALLCYLTRQFTLPTAIIGFGIGALGPVIGGVVYNFVKSNDGKIK